MADGEADSSIGLAAEGEHEFFYAEQQETAVVEHPAEEQELGQEGEQPGITAIEDPAGAAQADEDSNTVSNTEQQSNIESYTGRDNSPREEEQQQPIAQIPAAAEASEAAGEEDAGHGAEDDMGEASAPAEAIAEAGEAPEPGTAEAEDAGTGSAAAVKASLAPAPAVSSRPASAARSRPTSARPPLAIAAPPQAPMPGSRPASGSAATTPLTSLPQQAHAHTDMTSYYDTSAAVAAAASASRPATADMYPPGEPSTSAPVAALGGPVHRSGAETYIATGLKAIDVEVAQGPGMPHRLIRVLLDYTQMDRKPYLGGYRNKKSSAVYHHACTQTPRQPKYANAERKLTRDTQTVKQKKHSQQTVREYGTQMERPGVLLDIEGDRLHTPGRYQTADERDDIVLRATLVMQRWTRGWMGRKRATYLRQKKIEREAFLLEQERKVQHEAEEHRRKEIERRMHPCTAADFEILYNELEAWRLQETRKIKESGLPMEQQQQVLQQLLQKETKLLQTIDRLKINANHENKEVRIQKTLTDMSKPKKMELKNGGKVEVHTPFTTRSKELQQLYNGLNLPLLTVDERLDVLLHVKWTVKEFDCDLTREVVELIDREADLLNRGRNPKVLEGLRKRISGLFLRFIETPEFNPEATRFQIVPMDFEQYLYQAVGKATARPTLPKAIA